MTTIDYATALSYIQEPGRPELSIDQPGEQHWVLVLEAGLTVAGFAPGRCTDTGIEVVGHFDADMARMVEAFQTHHGWGATGVVGHQEWEALEASFVAYMHQVGDQVEAAMAPDVVDTFSGDLGYLGSQEERDALEFLHDYEEYRYGRLQPVGRQLHAFQLADQDPAFQLIFDEAVADRDGKQLGLYAINDYGDGGVRTAEQHARIKRREQFLKGAKVHADTFLGGVTYSAAKALGATEEQALAAGEFANTVWGMVDAAAGNKADLGEQYGGEHGGVSNL